MRKCNKNTLWNVLIGIGILLFTILAIRMCLIKLSPILNPHYCDDYNWIEYCGDMTECPEDYKNWCPHFVRGYGIIGIDGWAIGVKKPYVNTEHPLKKTFSCEKLTENLEVSGLFEMEHLLWLIQGHPSFNSSKANCTIEIFPNSIYPPLYNNTLRMRLKECLTQRG